MTRAAGTFNSGTISGTNNVNDLRQLIEDQLQVVQSNGGNAWETWEVLDATAGSRDVVFRTRGDRTLVSGAGDASVFVRITQVTAFVIEFRMYQDWSTLDSAGARESSTTQERWSTISATEDINWFCVGNEYEFTMVAVQGADEYVVSFGTPIRRFVPPSHRGICFTTAAATSTGSNVVISVDRDLTTDLVVGQYVWAYNLTAAGNTLESDAIQILKIAAITATTITLNITADLVTGSIIGMDPCPIYIFAHVNATTGTGYFTTFADGTFTGAAAQTASFAPITTLFAEADNDPGSNGLHSASRAIIYNSIANRGGPRGIPEFMYWAAQGAQSDNTGDRGINNYDTNDAYQYFTGLQRQSFGLMIGPGA